MKMFYWFCQAAIVGIVFSGTAFGHAVGNIALTIEDGRLVPRSVDTGQVLSTTILYQGYFGTEQEWDERRIYDHVNAAGTPIDASGNVAYTHPTHLQPHLQSTSGSIRNPLYVVDDFAWNFYPNTMSLPVRPGTDGSVDNQNITLHLLSELKVWNGTQFVETGGENVAVSIWYWTNTTDDGISDIYDTYRFPDGGWYAYPLNPVSPDGSDIRAGTYEFAPGDHYHWLLELTPDSTGNRDAGVYLLNVKFSTDAPGIGDSHPFSLLIANGLGQDLTSSLQHPTYLAAQQALTAVVPLPATAWLFGSAVIGLIGAARRKVAMKHT
ncbi:MAG: VPLPA-CTERM sorting domain-containing protein [Nitrospira sp.]|nr:VPLPA-CTERM sorting domain-containing protein [Nitrospira sp.]